MLPEMLTENFIPRTELRETTMTILNRRNGDDNDLVCMCLFPCILVVLFSVVTRSKWIGTLLTLILIGTSIYKGFFIMNGSYL